MTDKQLLFSIAKDQFTFQTFCSGGKGGQNQNKVATGARCIHEASGARGESREERYQHQNRQIAFRRCVESATFQQWLRIEIARHMGDPIEETPEQIMARVDHMIQNDLAEGRILIECGPFVETTP